MKILCIICLDTIDTTKDPVSVLKCGHVFHQNCITTWLENRNSCPKCKKIVIEGQIISKLYLERTDYMNVSEKAKDVITEFDKNCQEFQTSLLTIISNLEEENKTLKQNLRSVTLEADHLKEKLSKTEDKIKESEKLKDEVETLKAILTVVKKFENRNSSDTPKENTSNTLRLFLFKFKLYIKISTFRCI